MQVKIDYDPLLTLTVSLESNLTDQDEGYVDPDNDEPLKKLDADYNEFMERSHTGIRDLHRKLLSRDVCSPDSSGYPNNVTYVYGFYSQHSRNAFVEKVKLFRGEN